MGNAKSESAHPQRTCAGLPDVCYRPLITLAAITCAMAIAACGSSKSSRQTSGSSNPQLAVAECMRAHGVPKFPDPTMGSGGEGFAILKYPGSPLTVDGIAFSGPVFKAAAKTCQLGGGGTRPPISESQKLALLQFSQCMREHGVPDYPDPKFPPGFGIEVPTVPGLSLNSPAVKERLDHLQQELTGARSGEAPVTPRPDPLPVPHGPKAGLAACDGRVSLPL
jgi:hypothetical protein